MRNNNKAIHLKIQNKLNSSMNQVQKDIRVKSPRKRSQGSQKQSQRSNKENVSQKQVKSQTQGPTKTAKAWDGAEELHIALQSSQEIDSS